MLRHKGFTLVELLIGVAVLTVLALMAGPSLHDMILMQRLRGINAQLLTDLQFARAEAVVRGSHARLVFGGDSTQTCYTIYVAESTGLDRCDCTRGAGAACTAAGTTEVRTVSAPRSGRVLIQTPGDWPDSFAFSYLTGGLLTNPLDTEMAPLAMARIVTRIDDDRQLRNTVAQSGRPTVCAPNPARMQVTACP